MLSACDSQEEALPLNDYERLYSKQDDPTGQKEGEMNTTVMGSIRHGISWDDNSMYRLEYTGEEMNVPYYIQGSGIARKCGFLVFVDGIPHPYKVKEMDVEYQYMHIFELEENMMENYTLQFMPMIGKKGEKLSVCITSIIDPQYIPNMKDSFSYGHTHESLAAVYPIVFQENTLQDILLTEKIDETSKEVIHNLVQEETEIDLDYIEELDENVPDLNSGIETGLYIDGDSMKLSEVSDISGKEIIHIQYIIMGHPEAKYKTSFYLNHEPLVYQGKNAFTSLLKKGQMESIEFDLDTENLENTTFYAVSVPCNSADYPDDVFGIYKSNSICFYKE